MQSPPRICTTARHEEVSNRQVESIEVLRQEMWRVHDRCAIAATGNGVMASELALLEGHTQYLTEQVEMMERRLVDAEPTVDILCAELRGVEELQKARSPHPWLQAYC